MIQSLRGVIREVSASMLYVDVGGVEYMLFISHPASEIFEKLVDTTQRILTYLHITERNIELYGFSSASERMLFFALLKVDGIGPKAALKIVGHTTADEFFTLVYAYDVTALAKLPGIGVKKANKILVTLENVFVATDKKKSSLDVKKKHGVYEDIRDALLEMGYYRHDIERIMNDVFSVEKNKAKDEAHIMKEMIIALTKNSNLQINDKR